MHPEFRHQEEAAFLCAWKGNAENRICDLIKTIINTSNGQLLLILGGGAMFWNLIFSNM